MTKVQYLFILDQCNKVYIRHDTFFEWLIENPNFIHQDPLEIEINFLIHSVAKISYAKGFLSAFME